MNIYTRKLLMSVIALACCSGESFADGGWAEGVAITSESAFFAELDLSGPGLEAVRAAVEKKDWPAAKEAWGQYLEAHVLPRWIWSHHDRDATAAYLKERGRQDGIVAAAEAIVRREKGLGGKRDIDWAKGRLENRHGPMNQLGIAWMLTGDARYAEDWAYLMRDWIADSPVSSNDGLSAGTRALAPVECGGQIRRGNGDIVLFWRARGGIEAGLVGGRFGAG